MTDRPIIFSPDMIRALLAGRKTQTRRLATSPLATCKVGDHLWVKEAFSIPAAPYEAKKVDLLCYAADTDSPMELKYTGWRSATHMPRLASRLTLVVTATKTEPLWYISAEDALAEGCEVVSTGEQDTSGYRHAPEAPLLGSPQSSFEWLWDHLNGNGSWDDNPEVVAISFECHQANIDSLPKAA